MLPNLLCIGAAKCGTTSLHRYLSHHPQIFMAEQKELEFFTGPRSNWRRGIDWYEEHFPVDVHVRGESSPGYSVDPLAQGVPERIASTLPNVKLIYIVGDPIERVITEWVGNTSAGQEARPLRELIAEPRFAESVYVWRSRYAHQLGRYLEVFPSSDVHVVVKEDLATERERTMSRVFRFLGVDESFTTPAYTQVHKASAGSLRSRSYPRWMRGQKPLVVMKRRAVSSQGRSGALARRALSRPLERPALSQDERRQLTAYFGEDPAQFRALTGLALEKWSV